MLPGSLASSSFIIARPAARLPCMITTRATSSFGPIELGNALAVFAKATLAPSRSLRASLTIPVRMPTGSVFPAALRSRIRAASAFSTSPVPSAAATSASPAVVRVGAMEKERSSEASACAGLPLCSWARPRWDRSAGSSGERATALAKVSAAAGVRPRAM